MSEQQWRSTYNDEPGWQPLSYRILVKDENGKIFEGSLELDDVSNSGDDEYPIWAFIDQDKQKYILGDFEEFVYVDDEEGDRDENK